MASKLFVLIVVCTVQGTWSYPSPAVTGSTSGTGLFGGFRKNLAALTTPALKLAVETVPGVVNTGVQTASQRVAKLSEANRENSAKIASGISKAVEGGATLGSAVAGGLLQMAGGGVEAINKAVDSGAKGAFSIGGQLADNGISRLGTLATLGQGFLDTAGDGMTAAGGGVTVFTSGVTKIMEGISSRMEESVKNAAAAMTKLMKERAATTDANINAAASALQTNMYTMFNYYLQAVSGMQNMLNSVVNTVSNSGDALTAAAAANTGSGGVTLTASA